MKHLEVKLSFVFDGIDAENSQQADEVINRFGKLMGKFKADLCADSVWFDEARNIEKREVVFGDIVFYEERAVIRAIDEIAYLPETHIEDYAYGRDWIIPSEYDGEVKWPTEENNDE